MGDPFILGMRSTLEFQIMRMFMYCGDFSSFSWNERLDSLIRVTVSLRLQKSMLNLSWKNREKYSSMSQAFGRSS